MQSCFPWKSLFKAKLHISFGPQISRDFVKQTLHEISLNWNPQKSLFKCSEKSA